MKTPMTGQTVSLKNRVVDNSSEYRQIVDEALILTMLQALVAQVDFFMLAAATIGARPSLANRVAPVSMCSLRPAHRL